VAAEATPADYAFVATRCQGRHRPFMAIHVPKHPVFEATTYTLQKEEQ
jgi:hypothetical protein